MYMVNALVGFPCSGKKSGKTDIFQYDRYEKKSGESFFQGQGKVRKFYLYVRRNLRILTVSQGKVREFVFCCQFVSKHICVQGKTASDQGKVRKLISWKVWEPCNKFFFLWRYIEACWYLDI